MRDGRILAPAQNPAGPVAGPGVAVPNLLFPLSTRFLDALGERRELLRGERPLELHFPVLPAETIPEVLKPAGRNSIKVELVSTIAFARLARGIASVNAPIGNNV